MIPVTLVPVVPMQCVVNAMAPDHVPVYLNTLAIPIAAADQNVYKTQIVIAQRLASTTNVLIHALEFVE